MLKAFFTSSYYSLLLQEIIFTDPTGYKNIILENYFYLLFQLKSIYVIPEVTMYFETR